MVKLIRRDKKGRPDNPGSFSPKLVLEGRLSDIFLRFLMLFSISALEGRMEKLAGAADCHLEDNPESGIVKVPLLKVTAWAKTDVAENRLKQSTNIPTITIFSDSIFMNMPTSFMFFHKKMGCPH